MSIPALDEREHRNVIRAALAAAVGADRVYDYDDAPKPLPPIYALLSFERTHTPPRHGGVPTRSAWYVNVEFGGRSVDEARWASLRIAEALDGARFTINDHESTPLDRQSGRTIEEDGGRYVGLSTYQYTL